MPFLKPQPEVQRVEDRMLESLEVFIDIIHKNDSMYLRTVFGILPMESLHRGASVGDA